MYVRIFCLCYSFGKFSAGEAARVNLATILAMQKLVNANCDDGKGLDVGYLRLRDQRDRR